METVHYVVIGVLFLVLLTFVVSKSKFGNNLNDLLTEKYKCNSTSDRQYPSGNVSGNYLNLNEYEKNELLRKFVENGN
jgi:hypothetical protein